ncbi:MAG: hypothetical protein ACRC33_15495 [Gemmataceae bacterium]
MTAATIRTLRDELAAALRDTRGVSGVGVGKDGRDFVLVVSVDPPRLTGVVPTEFKGVPVRKEDLSDAEFQSLKPGGDRRGRRSREGTVG